MSCLLLFFFLFLSLTSGQSGPPTNLLPWPDEFFMVQRSWIYNGATDMLLNEKGDDFDGYEYMTNTNFYYSWNISSMRTDTVYLSGQLPPPPRGGRNETSW